MYGYETRITMNMDADLAKSLHADYDMRQDFAALLAKELGLAEITYDVFVDPHQDVIQITMGFPSLDMILEEIMMKLTGEMDDDEWDDDLEGEDDDIFGVG